MPDLASPNKLACIDLSHPDLAASAALVRQACIDCGFFYVINHGIEPEFIDRVFQHSTQFFALPIQEKMKLFRDKNNRGYTPMFDETLDPSRQSTGDCKEGYYIGVEVPEDDPRSSKAFYGPNQWPDSELLPNWRETMEQYYAEASKVGKKVAKLIALALNLEGDYFEKPGRMDDPVALIRLLHYSGDISNPEGGMYGAGAHSDWGLLTLLATDNVPGLQICKEKLAQPQIWEDVPPIEGAFIVNIGDMLERWSNGLFRSTLHRVLTSGKERYSIPFFFEPNTCCLVECLPTCTSEDNPPRYPPILSGEYLAQRYHATHGLNTDNLAQQFVSNYS